MDIIINDDSINQQYSKEEFLEYIANDLSPMLEKIQKCNGRLLKEYNTYNKLITNRHSLFDLLVIQGDPIIDRLREYLVELTRKPFWNDDIRTSEKKKYKCLIEDVPNCITETYEREGILLSFKDDRYGEPEVKVVCDDIEETVRNANNETMFDIHLKELGYLISWDKNSFIVKSLGYKFEIRFSETPHYTAHFHMSNADEDLEFSIPDADLLNGETRNQNAIVSWALNNMDQIVDLWNRCQPKKKVKNWKY